jgi:hypothetical protein
MFSDSEFMALLGDEGTNLLSSMIHLDRFQHWFRIPQRNQPKEDELGLERIPGRALYMWITKPRSKYASGGPAKD